MKLKDIISKCFFKIIQKCLQGKFIYLDIANLNKTNIIHNTYLY